jgi:hypothetical protein
MLRNPEIFALIGLLGLSTALGATLFLVKTVNYYKSGRK